MKTKQKQRPFKIGQKVLVLVSPLGGTPYIEETVIRGICTKSRGEEQYFNVRRYKHRAGCTVSLIKKSHVRHVGWRGKADLLEILGAYYDGLANQRQKEMNQFTVRARDHWQDAKIMRMVRKMK